MYSCGFILQSLRQIKMKIFLGQWSDHSYQCYVSPVIYYKYMIHVRIKNNPTLIYFILLHKLQSNSATYLLTYISFSVLCRVFLIFFFTLIKNKKGKRKKARKERASITIVHNHRTMVKIIQPKE